jgi:HEAT repeat protein
VRRAAVEALDKLGDDRAVKPLAALLADKDSNLRSTVEGTLVKFKAVDTLIEALKSSDANARERAASALGKLEDKQATRPLIALLSDRESRVRQSAAEALGKLGDKEAVEPLIALLADRETNVRRAAVEALDKLGDDRAVKPLAALLADKDSNLRSTAREALVKLEAVDVLIEALKQSNPVARIEAARALGRLGDRKAIEPLNNLLQTETDESVKSAVKDALKQLQGGN